MRPSLDTSRRRVSSLGVCDEQTSTGRQRAPARRGRAPSSAPAGTAAASCRPTCRIFFLSNLIISACLRLRSRATVRRLRSALRALAGDSSLPSSTRLPTGRLARSPTSDRRRSVPAGRRAIRSFPSCLEIDGPGSRRIFSRDDDLCRNLLVSGDGQQLRPRPPLLPRQRRARWAGRRRQGFAGPPHGVSASQASHPVIGCGLQAPAGGRRPAMAATRPLGCPGTQSPSKE